MSRPGTAIQARGEVEPGIFWYPSLLARDGGLTSTAGRSRRRLWMVCYDIAEPRRLGRVARLCERHGMRIQYSVFAILADRREIETVREELAEVINEEVDDVRFYPVAANRPIQHVGRALQPGDLLPAHPALAQLRLALT